MKVKITCPRCGSENVRITSDEGDPTPLYKCGKCGHKAKLFPQIGTKKDEED